MKEGGAESHSQARCWKGKRDLGTWTINSQQCRLSQARCWKGKRDLRTWTINSQQCRLSQAQCWKGKRDLRTWGHQFTAMPTTANYFSLLIITINTGMVVVEVTGANSNFVNIHPTNACRLKHQ